MDEAPPLLTQAEKAGRYVSAMSCECNKPCHMSTP